MRRSSTTLGLLGALAAVAALTSCSTFDRDDTAAEVNGQKLSMQQLSDLADGSTDATVLRAALGAWIQVEAALDTPVPIITRDDITTQRTKVLEGLLAEYSDEARSNYEQGFDGAGFLCLGAIPLDASTDADTVLAAMKGGLSLADAAKKYSADDNLANSGGVVTSNNQECVDPATFEAGLSAIRGVMQEAKAKVGTPVAVDSGAGDGSMVILVLRAFDDLDDATKATIAAPFMSPALLDRYATADVRVNDNLGTWNALTGQVDAPGAG